MIEPRWLTPPIVAVHELDASVLADHPADSTGRGLRLHAHTIRDDAPVDEKNRLGAHLDKHHGGTPIIPYT